MNIKDRLTAVAENVPRVYNAGASDFGLKESTEGSLVTFGNVHPKEHKVGVKLSSKNLFSAINENIPIVSGVKYCLTSAEDTTQKRINFWLYDADMNELKILSQNIYGFYYGSSYGYWLCGSDVSKLNFSITFPAEVKYIKFRNAYVDMQLEIADAATAFTPYISDFSGVKVTASGKNLLNLEGREAVDFGGHGNTTKRQFFGEKGIVLGFARNNYYNGFNQDYEWTINSNSFSYTNKVGWYGIGFDLKLLPNTTYRFGCQSLTGGVSLTEYDAEGNYLGDNYFSDSAITTKPNTSWGMIVFYDDISKISSAVNPQVEYGPTITEYEQPRTSTEHTADAEGTVEGVKSISPIMNLSTDTAGVEVKAECFLDPVAVREELTNTILTLGGEI